MFYLVSKVFWLLVQPVSLAFLLGLIGVVLTWLGWKRRALLASCLGLLVIAITSFTNVGAVLLAPLENRFERPVQTPAQVNTIVLLGGATAARVSTARQITEISEAGDRLVETVLLAQLYPDARIVLTGGVAPALGEVESEAVTMQRLLLAFGIASERFVMEADARNTDENAQFTKALLGPTPGNVVLVTSAFHMPRSVGLFRKAGIDVVPWPTDFRSTGQESFGIDFAEPMSNLETASVAIKEWIGLAVYYWTGRIDDMLPAQVSN